MAILGIQSLVFGGNSLKSSVREVSPQKKNEHKVPRKPSILGT